MKHCYKLLLVLLCSMGTLSVFSQVTTAALSGLVTDSKGEAMPGATVVAVHEPSGTTYGTTSRTDGRYNLPNVRVGGPYKITATLTGFKTSEVTISNLLLGQKAIQDFKLEDAAIQVGEVEVVERASDRRTGSGSNVTSDQLRTLPTISRAISDFTRVVPLSAEGGSFGGRNDQFNNYTLDGAVFNNPFGLDAATPGGQANAQPIPLDAIDQVAVNFSPYDVTQAGFTGASVNSVTKSGANKTFGTFFSVFRNKNMIGTKVGDQEVFRGDLRQRQSGLTIGGALIENKLFFLASVEVERRSDLGSNFVANRGTGASNESRVLASDLDLVSSVLNARYGYETGPYENFKYNTNNEKGLLKLDWNVAKGHTLTLKGSFLNAFREQPAHPSAIGRRGPDFLTLQYRNSGYRINNNLYQGIAELNSLFGNKFSNKFRAGYSAFRDNRDPFSSPFPVLNISKNGTRYIVAGHEPFSINNVLDQDAFQLSDDVSIFLNKHTVTIGGAFERFNFNNSFNLTGYGARVFFPDIAIDTFAQWIASGAFDQEVRDARAAAVNNNANGTWALAETNLGQGALYAQDEWQVSDKLLVTVGVRMDMPLYFNTQTKMEENIARNCCYDPTIQYYNGDGESVLLDSKQLPAQKPLFSPRLGFNYDVKGDKSMQIRGGSGLFTGRFPFVWIGNQVANPNFFFYCTTDPDFKFPQVWRSDIGFDIRRGNGWTASVDLIYTKDVNAVMVRNYGLKTPTGTLQGPGGRPIYQLSDRATVFGGATNAYVVTNTNVGASINAMLNIGKNWRNGGATLGYNFLDAQDAASIDAEISSDAYDRNPAVVSNSNAAQLSQSLYGNRHRFVGTVSQSVRYGKFGTTVTLFGELVRGGRYSYTYAGDINNDGSSLNDLLYIPTDGEIDQMSFSGDETSQRAAFKAYIAQDDYLSGRRGQFAEKYGSLSPWYSRLDMRILEDWYLPNGDKLQFSVDILNVGNLLNPDWGVRQFASYTGLAQPIGVSVANGVPTYSFDTGLKSTFFNDFTLNSRWQLQLGLRYNF